MNHASVPCPLASELPLLEHDALDPHQREELELHVENCPSCRAQLQSAATACCQLLPPELLLPLQPIHPSTLLSGHEIAGCRLLKPLGSGAASIVWLALEISTRREIALKLIPVNSIQRDDLRNRWQSEVTIAARMRHPNLIRLYRVEETSDFFALVFEYVPGETLAKRLHRELPPPAIAAQLIHTLANAVHSMHELQVLHLDLKPSNILLDHSQGESWELAIPRISDFGISTAAATAAACSTANNPQQRPAGCGTPPWTAPEQLLLTPNDLTPAADVHGLGSLLYALLTGQPPLPYVPENQLLDTILRQLPTPPEQLQPHVPAELSRICLKCLRKHPADRYQSASHLATALDHWLTARPGTRRPQTAHRSLKIGIPVVLAVALTIPILFALPRLQQNQHSVLGTTTPTSTSSTNPTAPATAPPADFVSLLATPVAAHNTDSAQQLATEATQQTQLALTRQPQSSAELLRLGLLLQRAGERMNSSMHSPLYTAAADILNNAELLLDRAHQLTPDDQRVLQELAAVRICLGNLKTHAAAPTSTAGHRILREQILKLCECAAVASQMNDCRQQVYWLGQVLDSARVRCLHLEWAGHANLAAEIRYRITAALPYDSPASKSADIRFRMLLWEPSRTSASISPAENQPDSWLFPDHTRQLQLEAVCNFIASALFSAPLSAPFSPEAAQQCLANAGKLMHQLGLQEQLLPRILNTELVRPIAAVSSEARVLNRLQQAEHIQHAWLLLCTEAQQLFPNHPEIHLALSEAHLQAWKNLLRRNRDNAAVAALRQSQIAAEAAWQAAPESEVAYRQIADRIQRLERFRSGH